MLREGPLVVKGACDRVARHVIARASRGRRRRARGRPSPARRGLRRPAHRLQGHAHQPRDRDGPARGGRDPRASARRFSRRRDPVGGAGGGGGGELGAALDRGPPRWHDELRPRPAVFGVSIALQTGRRVVLGVVYDPSRDELFVGERGRGATLNDAPIRVSATASLDASLLATGFPYNIRETRDTNLPEYAAFSVRARAVRRMGSAVLDLAYVACGRFDGFWELRLGSWDVAAGSLLVEEAGGMITGIDGGPLDVDAPTLVASNGLVHHDVLRVLKEVRGARRE